MCTSGYDVLVQLFDAKVTQALGRIPKIIRANDRNRSIRPQEKQ